MVSNKLAEIDNKLHVNLYIINILLLFINQKFINSRKVKNVMANALENVNNK